MKKIAGLVVLAAFVALVMPCAYATTPAHAAKGISLDVTYCGKKVTLIKDTMGANLAGVKVSKLNTTWGEGKTSSMNQALDRVEWKKGKTKISVTTPKNNTYGKEQCELGHMRSINLNIAVKNGSVCGVKVGMKKSKALKVLKKAYGKKKAFGMKAVRATKSKIELNTYSYLPITYKLKAGKVKSISWFRS